MNIIDLELLRSVDATCKIAYIVDGIVLDRMDLYREGIIQQERLNQDLHKKASDRRIKNREAK